MLALCSFLSAVSVILLLPQNGPTYPLWGTAAVLGTFLSLLWYRYHALASGGKRWSRAAEVVLYAVTCMVAVCWTLRMVYPVLCIHESPFIDQVIGCLMALISVGGVGFVNDGILVETATDNAHLAIGIERIDLMPRIAFVTTFLVGGFLAKAIAWRNAATCVLTVLLCLLAETVMMLALEAHCISDWQLRIALFTDPWIRSILVVIDAFVVYNVVRFSRGLDTSVAQAPAAPGIKKVRCIAACGLVALSGSVFLFQSVGGTPKTGKILVDDYHSGDWEIAAGQFDKDKYGARWLYGYSSFVRLMKQTNAVEVTNEPLSPEALKDVSILVIKTPIKLIDDAEISAIDAFVRNGGGLLVIGDHTNLLGMTSNVNRLCGKFGANFRNDGSNRLSTGFYTDLTPNALIAGPLLRGVDEMTMLTGCTIRSDSFIDDFMLVGSDAMSDHPDYGRRNFFGDFKANSAEHFGCFPLVLGKKIEKGRMVMLADGTFLSNFWIFHGDQKTLVNNIVNYLSWKNFALATLVSVGMWWIGMVWVISLATLLFLSAAMDPRGRVYMIGAAAVATTSLTLIFTFGDMILARGREAPPVTTVGFVQSYCEGQFPPPIGIDYSLFPLAMNSVFCAPQRLGMDVRLINGPGRIKEASRFVLPFPSPKYYFEGEANPLADYLRKGPTMLLVQDGGPCEAYLKRMGAVPEHTRLIPEKIAKTCSVYRVKEFEHPLYVVTGCAEFLDSKIGHPFVEPDQASVEKYEKFYMMLETLTQNLAE